MAKLLDREIMADEKIVSEKIVLKCLEGAEFVIEKAVAIVSQTLKHMIEDDCADNIPIPNVTAPILAMVIDYCKRHVAPADGAPSPPDQTDLKAFDEEFVKVDQQTLFELILAANYLDIRGMLEITCQAAADMIKDKTPEQVRTIFKITNDFTPEEEEAVRKENEWAYQ